MADYNSLLNLLKKCRENTNILIETGTNEGAGILMGIYAGFNKIYSCDIIEKFVKDAQDKFDPSVVTVYNCSSEDMLKIILNNINEPCTIFLDSHVMPNDASNQSLGFHEDQQKISNNLKIKNCPLLEELEIIKNSLVNNHTIIIDDVQCFGTWMYDNLQIESIIEKIKSINPNYNFLQINETYPPFLYCYT